MAIETERDPRLYAVDDDPMRAACTPAVISLTLFLLTVSFLLLGIGDAGARADLVKLGGWFGLASAAAALYAAFASVMNSTFERTLIPLVPLRRAHH